MRCSEPVAFAGFVVDPTGRRVGVHSCAGHANVLVERRKLTEAPTPTTGAQVVSTTWTPGSNDNVSDGLAAAIFGAGTTSTPPADTSTQPGSLNPPAIRAGITPRGKPSLF